MIARAAMLIALAMVASAGPVGSVASSSAAPHTPPAAARQVHASVTGAFPDGLLFQGPPANGKVFSVGVVDITRKPFSADPTGVQDSTQAIQDAIDFARQHQLATYFPSGRYLVSDTLDCIQGHYMRTNGVIGPARIFPNVLIGSAKGPKPTLVLAANAPGFGNPGKPKYVVHFWSRSLEDPDVEKPNIAFNQGIRGIDIELGESNPGAIGLRHRGAQGTFVQDVTIRAGNGLKGMEGGLGSGGTMINITVVGGQVGMDLSETQPAPVLVGAKLFDQKRSALIYKGAQTLTLVGSHIVSPLQGPLVKSFSRRRPFSGQMVIVDSIVEFTHRAGVIIKPAASVYLRNVYARNARQIFQGKAFSHDPLRKKESAPWIHIKEATHRVDPRKFHGHTFTMPVMINGKVVPDEINAWRTVVNPPADLVARHAWQGSSPAWDSKEFINVKEAPYSAKGDGIADDYLAIQSAIDAHTNIFLPKGVYRLSRSLKIAKAVNLRGVAAHLSILSFAGRGANQPRDSFPVLEVTTQDGETFMDALGLHVFRDIPNLYALDLNHSRNVSMRNVALLTRPTRGGRKARPHFSPLATPLVTVRQSSGIKIYGYYQEDYRGHAATYRHLAIENCPGPVSIYVCNVEHSGGAADLEISHSKEVRVYGLKSEGNNYAALIGNSANILIAGYGGNASAYPGSSLFRIQHCRNLSLASLTDSPNIAKKQTTKPSVFGRFYPPSSWQMIHDLGGQKIMTPAYARPLLYSIGGP